MSFSEHHNESFENLAVGLLGVRGIMESKDRHIRKGCFVLVSLLKSPPPGKFKLIYTHTNHFRGCLRTDLYVIHFQGML